MAGSTIAPVLNLVRQAMNVAPASAGLIITTHALFVALFSPIMGLFFDKVGVKRPFLFGLVLFGLAGGSGLVVNTYWVLIISRAFLGIAVAAIYNAVTVVILNLYQGRDRDKVMGWRGSANSFGGIAWPLLGGYLGNTSWHAPFAVYTIGVPLAILTLFSVPEVKVEVDRVQDEQGSVLKVLKENRVVIVLYGLMLVANVFLYTIVVYLPQRLEQIGISNTFHIGLFLISQTFSAGIVSLVYGRIRSRLSYRTILLIALALWTIGFTAISRVSSGALIAVSVAFFGVGMGLVMPTIMVWVGEKSPISYRGRVTSYIGMSGFTGQFLSPIAFAPAFLWLGFTGVFLVVGIICAVLFLLFLTLMRK